MYLFVVWFQKINQELFSTSAISPVLLFLFFPNARHFILEKIVWSPAQLQQIIMKFVFICTSKADLPAYIHSDLTAKALTSAKRFW